MKLFNTGFGSEVAAGAGVIISVIGSATEEVLEIALLGAILDLALFVETVLDLTFFEEILDVVLITSSACGGERAAGTIGGVITLTVVAADLIDRISLPASISVKLMSRKIEIINR
jgi:hypothetical protein